MRRNRRRGRGQERRPPLCARLARLHAFGADESGQALVPVALFMVVLVGMLGLAVDAGMLHYAKRQVQLAADAAALAGALEISTCAGSTNCGTLQKAAQNALAENGMTGSTLFTNCSAASKTTLSLTVNNPPCLLAGDPNRGSASVVETIVSAPMPTAFARIFGLASVPVSARAEAIPARATCVYALDRSGSNAMVLDSGTSVNATCGIVAESSSGYAVACTSASVNATSVSIVGSGTSTNCTLNPFPTLGASVPSPADPLATLAAPAVPACGSTTSTPFRGSASPVTITGTATLYPDYAYCGGITIKSGARVTFTPGVYVLNSSGSSGGLSIDVGATITGTSVTFYNYGTAGAIKVVYSSSTAGNVSLIAPTSGTYAGILFFQDQRNTNQATLQGSAAWNTVLRGTAYFPKAKVLYTYSGAPVYNILVAYDVEFAYISAASTGASSFSSDYSTLPKGSPVGELGASLVE